VRISGSNAGYTMLRGSVKSTGYPLHSAVSPSLLPPVRHCVPSHFNSSLNIAKGMNSEVWDKKRPIRLKTIYWSRNEPFTTGPFEAACHKVQTPT